VPNQPTAFNFSIQSQNALQVEERGERAEGRERGGERKEEMREDRIEKGAGGPRREELCPLHIPSSLFLSFSLFHSYP
jgi:hypothetical protein